MNQDKTGTSCLPPTQIVNRAIFDVDKAFVEGLGQRVIKPSWGVGT